MNKRIKNFPLFNKTFLKKIKQDKESITEIYQKNLDFGWLEFLFESSFVSEKFEVEHCISPWIAIRIFIFFLDISFINCISF